MIYPLAGGSVRERERERDRERERVRKNVNVRDGRKEKRQQTNPQSGGASGAIHQGVAVKKTK